MSRKNQMKSIFTLLCSMLLLLLGIPDPVRASGAMQVEYLGHSMVVLTSSSGTKILIDPAYLDPAGRVYKGNSGTIEDTAGLHPPDITPDAVVVTHEHFDHNNVHANWIKGTPQLIHEIAYPSSSDLINHYEPVQTKVGDIHITSVETKHQEGTFDTYGSNAAMVFEADGLKVVHLGDSHGNIRNGFTSEQLQALGSPDVLFIPISEESSVSDSAQDEYDRNANIDMDDILQAVDALQPKIIVPIHWWRQSDLNAFIDKWKEKSSIPLHIGNEQLSVSSDSLPAGAELRVLDHLSPEVRSTDPIDQMTAGVAVNQKITVNFNEKIKQGPAFSQLKLEKGAGNPIDAQMRVQDNQILIQPDSRLEYDSSYRVLVSKDAIQDEGGNGMKEDFLLSFYTGTQPTVEVKVPLSTGLHRGVAVKGDGTVWNWGSSVVRRPNLNQIVAVAAGREHSLALKSDGTVRSWSSKRFDHNLYGELGWGEGIGDQVFGPEGQQYLTDIVAVAAGEYHSVALKADGTVWTWGYNSYGQLGNGGAAFSKEKRPVQVMLKDDSDHLIPLTHVKAIAAGGNSTFAVLSDGTVYGWGQNQYGHLGNGTNENQIYPVKVSISQAKSVAAGFNHTLAVKEDGTVWSWGLNEAGQLGDNTTESKNLPTQVQGLDHVTLLSAGDYHSVALKEDGSVWAWGDQSYGALGNDEWKEGRQVQLQPVQMKQKDSMGRLIPLQDVEYIAANSLNSVVLKEDGTVWETGNIGATHPDPSMFHRYDLPHKLVALNLHTGAGTRVPFVLDATKNSFTFSDLVDPSTVRIQMDGKLSDIRIEGTTFTYDHYDYRGYLPGRTYRLNLLSYPENFYGYKVPTLYEYEYTHPSNAINTQKLHNQVLVVGEGEDIIDLHEYFRTEDGSPMPFSAYAMNNDLMDAFARGHYLKMSAKANGTTWVSIYSKLYDDWNPNIASAAFRVHAVVPSNQMTIDFAETARKGGVNFENIHLEEEETGTVIPVVKELVDSQKLVMTIEQTLTPGKRYRMVIPRGAVLFDSGDWENPILSWDHSFSFTAKEDMRVPQIESTLPLQNAIDVPVDQTIKITYDEEIQAGPNFDEITIISVDSSGVSSNLKKSISGNVLSISLDWDYPKFQTGRKYLLYIPDGAIQDSLGNPTQGSYELYFTTVDDLTAPQILGSSPADGATGVPVNSLVTIQFNEDVRRSMNFSEIKLRDEAGLEIPADKYLEKFAGTSDVHNTLTIEPLEHLAPAATFTVTVPELAVEDMSGNGLEEGAQFSFTTGELLRVVSSLPENGARDVDPSQPIRVDFNYPIYDADEYGSIRLEDSEQFEMNVHKSIEGQQLIIQPTSSLGGGQTYTLRIPTGSLKNEAGLLLDQDIAISFTMGTDTTAPRITSSIPAQGASDAPRTGTIRLNFSEGVQFGAGPSFELKDEAGNTAPLSYMFGDGDHYLELEIPSYGLEASMSYSMSIPASAILDMAGNPMDADFTLRFTTTGNDGEPPIEVNVVDLFDLIRTAKLQPNRLPVVTGQYGKAKENLTTQTTVFTVGSPVYSVDGVQKDMLKEPYIKEGKVLIPAIYLFEALGIDHSNVIWDSNTQAVTMIKGDTVVQFTVGSQEMIVSGEKVPMNIAPESRSEFGLSLPITLPVTYVLQAFRIEPSWDELSKSLTITIEK